ncbi:hypothetical protein SAMN04487819_101280 [Actinopolyspora alba]|uniref:Uncharacterized protein n=1 Tax=Actinopolyspora alba TaxID=673379 RepID=A0A1I1TQY3_9ACTN|nr:hypothetical protein [Actinopolyspora alba]SFD61022.1 hypothetical protein SAMN04487819_101280 [Actinopolyspora alba]
MTVLGYAAVLATERQPLVMVVAQDSGPGVQEEGVGKSTPLALFLILVLLIAVVFLARSMTRQLGKVPTRFDEQRAAAAAPKRVKRAEAARLARQREAGAADGAADGAAERTEDSDSSAASEEPGRHPGPEASGGEPSDDNAPTDDSAGDEAAERRDRGRAD